VQGAQGVIEGSVDDGREASDGVGGVTSGRVGE
jgi:hypothetical protein